VPIRVVSISVVMASSQSFAHAGSPLLRLSFSCFPSVYATRTSQQSNTAAASAAAASMLPTQFFSAHPGCRHLRRHGIIPRIHSGPFPVTLCETRQETWRIKRTREEKRVMGKTPSKKMGPTTEGTRDVHGCDDCGKSREG